MLKVPVSVITAIERGIKPTYKVRVYFQQPETYTENDYLQPLGARKTTMSSQGGYAIGNTTITLLNKNYYFSKKFARELPVKRLVEIYAVVGGTEFLEFRGIVSSWQRTKTLVTLQVNA